MCAVGGWCGVCVCVCVGGGGGLMYENKSEKCCE
jgi:hypothetical protein